jgi:hypothetical protein
VDNGRSRRAISYGSASVRKPGMNRRDTVREPSEYAERDFTLSARFLAQRPPSLETQLEDKSRGGKLAWNGKSKGTRAPNTSGQQIRLSRHVFQQSHMFSPQAKLSQSAALRQRLARAVANGFSPD